MIERQEGFEEEFSRLVRARGRWRDYSPEPLLGRWRTFVEECEQGYRHDSEDYFNDLTARDSLEFALNCKDLSRFPEMDQLRREVDRLDSRFRAVLIPDAFPRIPDEQWWGRGLVKWGSSRFVEEIRRIYGVTLDVSE